MITTVLFDLDGTLLPFGSEDFIRLYFGGLCKKLAPLGFEPKTLTKDVWSSTEAMVRNDGTRINHDVFWETFKVNNPEKPDVEPHCDDFYTHEFDGVKQCLKYAVDRRPIVERLNSAGLQLILATNPLFPRCALETRLSWAGLKGSDFSYITSYENSSFCKPNPKYYAEILEKCGKQPSECIMVGNHIEEDMLPASSVGIEVFLVPEFLENPENKDISAFRQGSLEDAERFVINGKL